MLIFSLLKFIDCEVYGNGMGETMYDWVCKAQERGKEVLLALSWLPLLHGSNER